MKRQTVTLSGSVLGMGSALVTFMLGGVVGIGAYVTSNQLEAPWVLGTVFGLHIAATALVSLVGAGRSEVGALHWTDITVIAASPIVGPAAWYITSRVSRKQTKQPHWRIPLPLLITALILAALVWATLIYDWLTK